MRTRKPTSNPRPQERFSNPTRGAQDSGILVNTDWSMQDHLRNHEQDRAEDASGELVFEELTAITDVEESSREKSAMDELVLLKRYEEERSELGREIANLSHQLLNMFGGQDMIGLEKEEGEGQDLASPMPLHPMLGDCSKILDQLGSVLDNQSQFDGTIRELRSVLYANDQEIGSLNAKVSASSDVVVKRLGSLEESSDVVVNRLLAPLDSLFGSFEDASDGGTSLVDILTFLLTENYASFLEEIPQLGGCVAEVRPDFVNAQENELGSVFRVAREELSGSRRKESCFLEEVSQLEEESSDVVVNRLGSLEESSDVVVNRLLAPLDSLFGSSDVVVNRLLAPLDSLFGSSEDASDDGTSLVDILTLLLTENYVSGQCVAEVRPDFVNAQENELGSVFRVAREELSGSRRKESCFLEEISQLEEENKKMAEEVDRMKESLEEATAEASRNKMELDYTLAVKMSELQEKSDALKVAEECLFLAETKRKDVEKEHDDFKLSVDGKILGMENLKQDLQLHESAVAGYNGKIGGLSAALDQSERFLRKREATLRKLIQAIEQIALPTDKIFDGPVEKVNWIAEHILGLEVNQAHIKSLEDALSQASKEKEEMQAKGKVVDELSAKVKLLEGLIHAQQDIVKESTASEASSAATGSEISQIDDLGPLGKSSISPDSAVARVRTMGKGSTDQFALEIDLESDWLVTSKESRAKGHVFGSLNSSGLIPRHGKSIADRISGIWVYVGQGLIYRPGVTLALMACILLYLVVLAIFL